MQKALFKFYKPSAVFVQVFLLSDGTCAQNFSTPENQNTSIPYPWNPNDPGGPIAWGTVPDYTLDNPRAVPFRVAHSWPFIIKLFDREMYVTDAEKAKLMAAGYDSTHFS